MNNQEKGDLGEAIFITEATRRQYAVMIPLSKNLRFDLVIQRNGRLEKIQVKSTKEYDGCLRVSTKTVKYDSTFGHNNRNQNVKYKLGDFDWLAIVNIDNGKCYFVPAEKVINTTHFTLRLTPPKNNQQKKINLAEDFEVW